MRTGIQEHNLNILGARLLSKGDTKGALLAFEQFLETHYDDAATYYNIGLASHQLGRWAQAKENYQKALQLNPGFTEAFFNMGVVLVQERRPDQAIDFFLAAIKAKPDFAQAYFNLGIAYSSTGKKEKAIDAYEQTIRMNPVHAKALNNRGLLKLDAGNDDSACEDFKHALKIDPHFAEAYYNMGLALQAKGQFEEGRSWYLKACQADSDYVPAKWLYHLSLPKLYDNSTQIQLTRDRFQKNLEALIENTQLQTPHQQKQALKGIGTTTNFFLQYQGRDDKALQKRYGQFVCKVMAANFPQWRTFNGTSKVHATEKIRVGYVSAFIYGHTVGDFLLGWIENHDPSRVETYAYHLGKKTDAITHRVTDKASRFHHLDTDIETIAETILADDLQVLVFPEIGMSPLTLQLAGLKLAPVQCAGWGHPVTTGLPTIDFFLSSELMEPENADQYYTERLVRLPNLSLCYSPPQRPEAPKNRLDLGIDPHRFVFLSTQSLYKYLPFHDDIFPSIAAQVPNALFVFICDKHHGITENFKKRLRTVFAQYRLDSDAYCFFVPRLNHSDFLSLNLCADVLLDSLEWSGGHTTLEAISCGLPVVTLPGRFMRGRHTYAMLKKMAMDQTIALDKADYCQIASRLALDSDFYKAVRLNMINHRNDLFNDQTAMKALEDFYYQATEKKTQPSNAAHPSAKIPVPAIEKKVEKAIAHYENVLKKEPHNTEAAFVLGTVFLQCNAYEKALKWLQQAVEQSPGQASAHNNLGKVYEHMADDRQAQFCFEKALELEPNLAEAWFNLAELQSRAGQFESALQSYQKAIQIAPEMSAAHNNMGNLLKQQERYTEAIAAFKTVVTLAPELSQGHYNLGSTYRLTTQYPEAIAHLYEAIKLKPDYADAWNNLALTCKNMGDFERARTYLNKALHIDPDLSVARWNRSFVHFLMGDWPQGWRDFEARFHVPHWRTIYPHRLQAKRWNGRSVPDQTLLVHDEQGLGDTLQFVRYVPWVKARCKHLIFETRPELLPLLLYQQGLGIDEIIVRSDTPAPENQFDQYIPLLSIPGMANIKPETATEQSAYIRAPQEKITLWKPRLPTSALKIGLVWAGRPQHGNDMNRSCNLSLFAPLIGHADIQFIGLQKGPAAAQSKMIQSPNFLNIGSSLADFTDSAAVMAHLDLLITVDTAVAHLAGAMGKPVWVLIPYIPDWRWGTHNQQTPWYASMRLYRQQRPKDWGSVVKQMCCDLDQWKNRKQPTGIH